MGRRKIEIKAIKDDRNRSVYVRPICFFVAQLYFALHHLLTTLAGLAHPCTSFHFEASLP